MVQFDQLSLVCIAGYCLNFSFNNLLHLCSGQLEKNQILIILEINLIFSNWLSFAHFNRLSYSEHMLNVY